MNNSLVLIRKWLEFHAGSQIQIEKREDGDLDVIELELQQINVLNHTDPDDYLSASALLLQGAGTTLASDGPVRLPFAAFELPLTDNMVAEQSGNILEIETERAVYKLSVKE